MRTAKDYRELAAGCRIKAEQCDPRDYKLARRYRGDALRYETLAKLAQIGTVS